MCWMYSLVVTWMKMDGATAKLVPKGIHRVDKIRVCVKNVPQVTLRRTKAWLYAIFANQANIRIKKRQGIVKNANLGKHKRRTALTTAISVSLVFLRERAAFSAMHVPKAIAQRRRSQMIVKNAPLDPSITKVHKNHA